MDLYCERVKQAYGHSSLPNFGLNCIPDEWNVVTLHTLDEVGSFSLTQQTNQLQLEPFRHAGRMALGISCFFDQPVHHLDGLS